MKTVLCASLTFATLAACGQTHLGPDAGFSRDAAPEASVDSGPSDAGPLDAGAPDAGPLEDASTPDAGRPMNPQVYAFCVEMTELRCRGNETCCGPMAFRGSLDWFTGCEGEQVEEQCRQMASDSALYDGTLRWNEVEALAIIDALTAALSTCAAISRPFDYSAAFEGSLAERGDCTPDLPYSRSIGRFRCRDDLRCELSGYETVGRFAGVCALRGREGDTCTNDCGEDLWCDSGLREPSTPYTGRCAREESTRCGRDSSCRTRFCDDPARQCIEPEPSDTWCGYIGVV